MTSSENLNTIKNRDLLRMMGKVALPIAAQSLIASILLAPLAVVDYSGRQCIKIKITYSI